MRRVLYAFFAAVLCACASPALGPGRQGAGYYLQPAQLGLSYFPPAPEPDSAADKADMAVLREWQKRRTEADCARARSEAHAYFPEFFGGVSPFVKPLPAEAARFFERVRVDTDAAVDVVKEANKRPRPFRRDPSLEPCADRLGGYGYPSGHAAISRVEARILSALAPERSAQFLARADEAAWDRVLGGVHHPSDIEAGKRLGDSLYQQFLKNPAFRADMESLRRCLAR